MTFRIHTGDAAIGLPLLGAENLYRITAPHFCAGVAVAHDGAIIQTAPVLRWAFNKPWAYLRRWAEGKGYKVEKVSHRLGEFQLDGASQGH